MESLKLIRRLISPIADVRFFIDVQSESTYSPQEIAGIIRGANYEKAQQKLREFIERCNETLSGLQSRVDETKAEYDSALSSAKSSNPGSGPSGMFVDNSSQESVNRHNEKVERYNNQLQLHRRNCDQAERAKERYDTANERYKEKKADLDESIRDKQDDLSPALDQDILAFLGKLRQLVYDCIHNKGYTFEPFVLIYMAKKAYLFLYDRIENAISQKTATDTFKQLNDELDALVENHRNDIQKGLAETFAYIFDSYKNNEAFLEKIQLELERLPYAECKQNLALATRLTNLSNDTEFNYQSVIDPLKLSKIEQNVKDRKDNFQEGISSIDTFTKFVNPDFNLISEVKKACDSNLNLMFKNKQEKLGEAFTDSLFILSVFNESEQDDYLKKQKPMLEEIQVDIEQDLGVELTKLVRTITKTELLTKSTADLLKTDSGLAFLAYQPELIQSRKRLVEASSTLDQTLAGINRLPEEKALEFSSKLKSLLGFSVVPIGNLGALIPIQSLFKTYKPALSSDNSAYVSLRRSSSGKIKTFLYVHIVVAILSGLLSFSVDDEKKGWFYGLSSSYILSAIVLQSKKSELEKL